MNKRVAIVQSNYIPWKGYFDLIAAVDEFILYDDVQYTRRDWRNRNQIKTPQGIQWLTVPVKVKGKYFQSIRDTEIDGSTWAMQHWKSLTLNYQKADNFHQIKEWLEPLYLSNTYTHISELNEAFLKKICEFLGIVTKITRSSNYDLTGAKDERILNLCRQTNCSEYISGPAAKNYLTDSSFNERGMSLTWFSYDGYREYPQLWGDFAHGVTILDLLFNCGDKARTFMRY